MLFIDIFDDHLNRKCIKNKNKIICGDFNICLMKSTTNTESLMFLNTLIGNQLQCHVFKPTRIEHYKDSIQVRSMSLIDQISSNLMNYKCKSGNLYYSASDHFPNFLIVENFLQDTLHKNKKPLYRG